MNSTTILPPTTTTILPPTKPTPSPTSPTTPTTPTPAATTSPTPTPTQTPTPATRSRPDDWRYVPGHEPGEALRRAKLALRREDEGARAAALYLAELVESGGYRALGFRSVRRFFTEGTRRSVSYGKKLLAIGRALPELPVIDERFAGGRLNKTQVQHLVGVAVRETEVEWADLAEPLTEAQLKRELAGRQKGDRPTDPRRRRIHEPKTKLTPVLDSTEYRRWQLSREKFEAECGRPVTDGEMLVEFTRMHSLMEPDGTVPGWRRVNSRHYVLHAWPRETPEGALEFVTTDEDGEVIPVDLASLTRSLSRRPPGTELALPMNRVDLSLLDPANHERVVPMAKRDGPTPPDMRERVLERDGYQCRSCGSRENVTVHHLVWRSYGGQTVEGNLVSLCEGCHSLVHARFLVVLGDPLGELSFFDYRGRPRGGEPLVSTAQALDCTSSGDAQEPDSKAREPLARDGTSLAPRRTLVDLEHLPDEVDADWWRRHQHLIDWNERQGELMLTPGYALESERSSAAPAAVVAAGAVSGAAPASGDVASPAVVAGPKDVAGPGVIGAPLPGGCGLASLVGQVSVRERLEVAIAAARLRGEQLGHVLFTGPPGLGKTSLARAVAVELGARISILPAPHVRTPDMLVRALAGLDRGDVLFLDEVHGLPARVAEVLYGAMDSGVLSVPVRQGVRSRTLRVRVQPFTLVGATTDPFQLPRPFQSRFRELKLEFYGADELAEIVSRAAHERGFVLTPEGAERLAAASGETPRRALKLLEAVRDEAAVARTEVVGVALVEQALAREEIDLAGLGRMERRYMRALEQADGPIGVKTLAGQLGTSEAQLVTEHEPELLRRGYVRITPAGRVLGSAVRARRVDVALGTSAQEVSRPATA